ncbi:putative dihydroxyacetone kinase regulator [Roseibium album]|nr:putative dihydroxyacetone kinase regulator [Roseibium album]
MDRPAVVCPIRDGTMDRRSRKTRAQLTFAMVQLLQEHAWEDISVRHICDAADVARSTFYLHFASKVELLDYGFRFLKEELKAAPRTRSLDADGRFGCLPEILRAMTSPGHAFLFSGKGRSEMTNVARAKLLGVIETLLEEELRASNRFQNLPTLEIAFLAAGVFGVVAGVHDSRISGEMPLLLEQLDATISGILNRP